MGVIFSESEVSTGSLKPLVMTVLFVLYVLVSQVVFDQFRLVVAAHQSVLVSMRASADKHVIEVHLYSMPDVWSKVQAAVSNFIFARSTS